MKNNRVWHMHVLEDLRQLESTYKTYAWSHLDMYCIATFFCASFIYANYASQALVA